MDEIQRHHVKQKNPDKEPYIFNDDKSQNSRNRWGMGFCHIERKEAPSQIYCTLETFYILTWVVIIKIHTLLNRMELLLHWRLTVMYFTVYMLDLNKNKIYSNHTECLHYFSLYLTVGLRGNEGLVSYRILKYSKVHCRWYNKLSWL